MVLNRTKGIPQGFLFLLFPFVLLISGSIWLVSLVLPSAKWSDEYFYQNGDDYLVVEVLEAGFMSDEEDRRIIRTASPMAMIRRIEDSQLIKKEDNIYNNSKSEITFANKTWHKISMPDE